ncbi:MAG: nuclear transport factor 2 family protein [Dehalococcoidia bacterium]
MPNDSEIAAVERYIHATASSSTTPEELAALVHPEVQVTIHPNIAAPTGTRSTLPEMQAGLKAGQSLMAWQKYDIHGHDLPVPDRVISRTTWTGELAVDLGPWPAGTRLRAEIAMFFSLRNGLIYRQENFDCYHVPATPAPPE